MLLLSEVGLVDPDSGGLGSWGVLVEAGLMAPAWSGQRQVRDGEVATSTGAGAKVLLWEGFRG